MATASIPNTFINGQNADANDVNANFSYIMNWLNTNVIQPDLANFSIFPTLPTSNPTSAYQAVHKNYVDLWLPASTIIQFGGVTPPAGWLLCDGATYDGANPIYSRLWGAIGTTYGGSGINSFQVPDLKGRVPVGMGAGTGLTARALNDKAGTETHTLTQAEIPSHQHTGATSESATSSNMRVVNTAGLIMAFNHLTGYDSPSGSSDVVNAGFPQHSHPFTTNPTGGSGAHNNMQPFVVVNYLIKL